MATAHPFRSPLLSSLYRVSGWTLFGLSGIAAAVTLFSGPDDVFIRISAAGGVLVVGFSVLVGSLGIAEILDCIARTAHHTEQIATLISANLSRLSSPPARASRAPAADAPRLTDLAGSTTASCPSCMAELDIRSLRKGINRCPSCGVQFTAE